MCSTGGLETGATELSPNWRLPSRVCYSHRLSESVLCRSGLGEGGDSGNVVSLCEGDQAKTGLVWLVVPSGWGLERLRMWGRRLPSVVLLPVTAHAKEVTVRPGESAASVG